MKAVFGILALVIVLAVVGVIAKKQLQVVGGAESAGRNAAAAKESGAFSAKSSDRGIAAPLPAAIAVDANAPTVPQQSRDMQERARANTVRALEQGAQRNQGADN